jgi:putative spermidine/putrescine transport system ATP-binding protein
MIDLPASTTSVTNASVTNDAVTNGSVTNGKVTATRIGQLADALSSQSPSFQGQSAQAQGVSLRAVTKQYGNVTAVKQISLDISAGTYCCLLGPSGCGKTTTLRMIAGHETPSSGDVCIGLQRVNDLPPARRDTAMVFQNYALFPHKSVWQNVDFGLKMRGLSLTERKQRVGEILEIVGLSGFCDRKPTMLSGGQQQRVALARALVTRPKVLLLDEPLSALDESLRVKTRGELRKLQKQFGMTFIQVTHAQDEAFSLSDQIVVMDHGIIDQVGAPSVIFHRPASQFVAQFVGDNNILQGQVCGVTPDAQGALVEIRVPQLGQFICRATSPPDPGMNAAFCIRSDALDVTDSAHPQRATAPAESHIENHTENHAQANHLEALITAIEFTGYLTRVSLLLPANGQEILYKARTEDWLAKGFQEGQTISLHWSPDAAIYLSH